MHLLCCFKLKWWALIRVHPHHRQCSETKKGCRLEITRCPKGRRIQKLSEIVRALSSSLRYQQWPTCVNPVPLKPQLLLLQNFHSKYSSLPFIIYTAHKDLFTLLHKAGAFLASTHWITLRCCTDGCFEAWCEVNAWVTSDSTPPNGSPANRSPVTGATGRCSSSLLCMLFGIKQTTNTKLQARLATN